MSDIASYSYNHSIVPLPPAHNIFCVFVLMYKSAGLVAPVLAEVLYDKGGPVAPLLVFGPTMIITGFFAGEVSYSGIFYTSSASTRWINVSPLSL